METKTRRVWLRVYKKEKLNTNADALNNSNRVNPTESLIVHTDDLGTVHSSPDNTTIGIRFTEQPLNTFNEQIIFEVNLFKTKRRRIITQSNLFHRTRYCELL